MPILLIAIILGIVEGVTEFLPVSSTGHLILATELLGFDADKWAAFNVIIQLGAILAIVVLYWRTFWAVLEGLIKANPVSLRFVRNILIGFLPSAILGFLLINKIEALLGAGAHEVIPELTDEEGVPTGASHQGRGQPSQAGVEVLTDGGGHEAFDARLVEPAQVDPGDAVEAPEVGEAAGEWLGHLVARVAERADDEHPFGLAPVREVAQQREGRSTRPVERWHRAPRRPAQPPTRLPKQTSISAASPTLRSPAASHREDHPQSRPNRR
jgi:hypothetical protein